MTFATSEKFLSIKSAKAELRLHSHVTKPNSSQGLSRPLEGCSQGLSSLHACKATWHQAHSLAAVPNHQSEAHTATDLYYHSLGPQKSQRNLESNRAGNYFPPAPGGLSNILEGKMLHRVPVPYTKFSCIHPTFLGAISFRDSTRHFTLRIYCGYGLTRPWHPARK